MLGASCAASRRRVLATARCGGTIVKKRKWPGRVGIWIRGFGSVSVLKTERSLYGRTEAKHEVTTALEGILFQHPSLLGVGTGDKCDGEALVTFGGTTVRAVCIVDKKSASSNAKLGFFPLTVEYKERAHAAGRVPKTSFRREIPGKDHEILVARMIDRALRPRVVSGFFYSTQLVVTLESFDGQGDPEILALNACSAALHMTGIPWAGPVGAIRAALSLDATSQIGMIIDTDGIERKTCADHVSQHCVEYSCNSLEYQRQSAGFVVAVAAADPDEIVMLEGNGRTPVPNDLLLAAVEQAASRCASIKQSIEEFKACAPPEVARATPFQYKLILPSSTMREHAKEAAGDLAAQLACSANVSKRDREIAQTNFWINAMARLEQAGHKPAESETEQHHLMQTAVHDVLGDALRSAALNPVLPSRPDGRALDEIRPIQANVGILPCAHGSALFSRGNTQVLCSVALGGPQQAQTVLPTVEEPRTKTALLTLTYNFPPYSINRTGQVFGRNRRCVGHGKLAEKAQVASLVSIADQLKDHPCERPFPFSININSEVTGSDGSSSMASVCGAALALLDASVPIDTITNNDRKHAIPAGVSIGLYVDPRDPVRFALPIDILGMEDHFGDMDFKQAGTVDGITALQLDIKLPSVSRQVIKAALEAGSAARVRIIDEMTSQAGLDSPRKPSHSHLPVAKAVLLDSPLQIRMLLTNRGKLKRQIEQEYDVQLDVQTNEGWEDDPRLLVIASCTKDLDASVQRIAQETTIAALDVE